MSTSTIANNEEFMRFLVTHIKTDLDKLTTNEMDYIVDAIDGWTKKNGQAAGDSSKILYKGAFKRFLTEYGKNVGNTEMILYAVNFDFDRRVPIQLTMDTALSIEEINRIVSSCRSLRDKVIVELLYETGAKSGEFIALKIKDVEEHPYGYCITLNGSIRRKVLAYNCQQLLRQWLAVHPDYSNPEAYLFTTTRRYNENSFTVRENRTPEKDTPRQHRPLNNKQIGEIIKDAARRAGINKNVNPQLLRHSQILRLTNILKEQQLKKYVGWESNSPMTSAYIKVIEQGINTPEVNTPVNEVVVNSLQPNEVDYWL